MTRSAIDPLHQQKAALSGAALFTSQSSSRQGSDHGSSVMDTPPQRALATFRARAAPPHVAGLPTYVLVHGVGLSHRSMSRLARELTRTGRVVAVDLPGFGRDARKNRPAPPVTVHEYSRLIAQLCAKERTSADGHGSLIVVGHSMGVQVALEAALQDPGIVDGLVFVGAVVDPRHPTLSAQGLRLIRDFAIEPLLTCAMALRDYARCGLFWYLAEAREMLAYPTHRRIDDYQGPLLVVRGEHDPIAANDWSNWLTGRVTGARLATIGGRRHNVVHSDPVGVGRAIADFADTIQ